jgi:L-seryl-tRNA(Ser) seleniumtransferase
MDPRRAIPSVDRLLASDAFRPLLDTVPRAVLAGAVRAETDRARRAAVQGGTHAEDLKDPAWYASRVASAMASLQAGTLRPVINATGVILHTNLGRAPLAEVAIAAMTAAAREYSNLEYDLEAGGRGSRYNHCRELLERLTGAEDALVVNNNAAALVLALNTTARGRQAVISRGELVEIGGSFRVPEIMERSGAQLREVGSTNRTHLADYRKAISEHTGAVLKVHPSNFWVEGYTAEVGVAELAPACRAAGVPLIHDIGSGLLLPAAQLGLPEEPTPAESIRAGADVITMSGDKLLGGPQCGIILGSAAVLERMRKNPLCRALRPDKLTLAALGATLRLYLQPEAAIRQIPVLRMLTTPASELYPRVAWLAGECVDAGLDAAVADGLSPVGGGAAPGSGIASPLLRVRARSGAATAERRLRLAATPVVVRVQDDELVVDLRTVPPQRDAELLAALLDACRQ